MTTTPDGGTEGGLERGRARRSVLARSAHAAWTNAARDPVAVVEATNAGRIASLIPIRRARMSASPFAFYRGSAGLMALDLSTMPLTGLRVQACGDAHLSNFGAYATPERNVVFDLNDFDETLPGPWEWDIKRLVVSVVLVARQIGGPHHTASDAVRAAAAAYRTHLNAYAARTHLDVWYARVDVDAVVRRLERDLARQRVEKELERARSRTNLGALPKLTEVVDHHRQIADEPPLIVRYEPGTADAERVIGLLRGTYRRSLPPDRRVLLDRYRIVDVARKVVGVGSVGTRCDVALLLGATDQDPLFLQVKQALPSVLAPYVGRGPNRHEGRRVVTGQRLTQAASDTFLGWATAPDGAHVYVRQLHDMKGVVDPHSLSPAGLGDYADVCGWALARAHARSGDGAAIAGYLGGNDRFDAALVEFADGYADQVERDHAAYVAAGLPAEP